MYIEALMRRNLTVLVSDLQQRLSLLSRAGLRRWLCGSKNLWSNCSDRKHDLGPAEVVSEGKWDPLF